MLTAAGFVALLAVALGVALQPAGGDERVLVVRQLRRDVGPTASAAPTEIVTWVGADRLRRDEGTERTIVVRLDGGPAVVLDHAARTWRELSPRADAIATRGSGPALVVTPTEEIRVVDGRSSRRYLIGGSVALGNAAPPLRREGELWASEDAPRVPPGHALPALLGLPLVAAEGAAAELGKIRGLPVLQRMRTELMDRVEEQETSLVAVEERTAPPGLWEPPPGYGRAGAGAGAR